MSGILYLVAALALGGGLPALRGAALPRLQRRARARDVQVLDLLPRGAVLGAAGRPLLAADAPRPAAPASRCWRSPPRCRWPAAAAARRSSRPPTSPARRFGRDFALTDHTGKPRTLADFRGKAVVLFFGYTQCPDVCPTTLSELAEAMKRLGPDADARAGAVRHRRPGARHAGAARRSYVPAFDPSFLGLYGDAAATERDGEGIQDRLPEAAGRDAGHLHDGPLGRHVRVRSRRGGCAST